MIPETLFFKTVSNYPANWLSYFYNLLSHCLVTVIVEDIIWTAIPIKHHIYISQIS